MIGAGALIIAACGGSSGGAPPAPQSTLVLGPQASCDRDLSASPPDVTIWGADSGDYLADRFSLATGDFNDDGLGDVLVGAPLADGPDNGRKDAGEAYIIFGSKQPAAKIDLANGAPFTVVGERAGDNLGFTVAAGDVNGDGRTDAIVGGRFAAAGDQLAVGKAYVFYGRPDLSGIVDMAAAPPDVTITGSDAGDFFSVALATGDVNGDDIDDLLIGAAGGAGPKEDRKSAGEVSVVLGSTHLPARLDLRATPPFFTVYGANAGDNFPNHLAAGDLNGDGRDELIIGAPFVDAENREDAGRAYAVEVPGDGGSLDLASSDAGVQMTGGGRKDELGFEVASADINHDGTDDLIAGARDADGPGDATNNAGEVHILFGGGGLPSSRDLLHDASDITITSADAGDSLGFNLSTGDVNGDGLSDILAGVPLGASCSNSRPDGGEAHVLFGRDQWPGLLTVKGAGDRSFFGIEAGDEAGFSSATTDFNGDGIKDVVLGALQGDGPDNSRTDAGELYIIFSRLP